MNEIEVTKTMEKIEEEVKHLSVRVSKLELDIALSKNDYNYIIEKQDKSMSMLEKLMEQVDTLERQPVKRYELIVNSVLKLVTGAAMGYLLSGVSL